MGVNRGHAAIILGVGNLGRALLENFHFEHSGFTLTAAFDVDPAIVGQTQCGIPVYHASQLEAYLREHPTAIGVLTVPRSAADSIAGQLVRGGVKGIWNFTNIELNVAGQGVVVEDVHFADSLLSLSYMISEAL